MKTIWRILGVTALAGVAFAAVKALRQYQKDSVFELPATASSTSSIVASTGQKRSISPELLEILADPIDKKPLELLVDTDGKEWLVNRRNGYRYPVEDGIPIMLIEEGEKHRDASLVTAGV